MSVQFYGIPRRFVSEIHGTALEPTTNSLTTALILEDRFQAGNYFWRGPLDVAGTIPPHVERAGTYAREDSWDAYELCSEHANSAHRGRIGFSAYRFELADAAVGSSLASILVRVSGDPYLPQGAHLSLATSDESTPATDYATVSSGVAAAAGVAPRTINGTTWYGASAIVTTITPAAALTLKKYLWLYVSLETYGRARNGWLEGGACLVGNASLELSAAPTGFSAGDVITVATSAATGQVLAQVGVSAWPQVYGRKTVSTAGASSYSWAGPGIVTFIRNLTGNLNTAATAANATWARALLGVFPAANKKTNVESTTATDGMLEALCYAENNSAGASNFLPQPGITFGLGALGNGTTGGRRDGATATYYLCPLPPEGGTYSRIVLANDTTARAVNYAAMRFTAWAMPLAGINESSANELMVRVAALASVHSFWLGDAATISGTVTGNASGASSDGKDEEYTATATRLGRSDAFASIPASGKIEIPLTVDVPAACLLIIVPMLSAIPEAVPNTTSSTTNYPAVGFLPINTGTVPRQLAKNTGWLPGVTIEV